MTNRSKNKGTAAETAVVRACDARGIPARRVALAGNQDQGDVHLWDGAVVVEVKAGDQTRSPSWARLADWFEEAAREADRVPGADLAVLVTKRHGSGDAGDWFAYVNAADYFQLTHDCGTPNRGVLCGRGVFVSLRLAHLLDHLHNHYQGNTK